jgi:hypothetical protein
MLTGCVLDESEGSPRALTKISRFNDDVQGFLFEPTRLAPTYPASMITRPFPSTPSTAKAKSRRWMKKTTDSKSRAL